MTVLLSSAASRVARVLLLAGLAVFQACASAGRPLPVVAEEANRVLAPTTVVLAPGDVVDVRFPSKKEWDQLVRVRPDGRATFPALPEFEVQGKTLPEVRERLLADYVGILTQPSVDLGVATFASRKVYVMGEVHEPGEIVLDGRLTFVEALAQAGGPLKETALLKSVLFLRWDPAQRSQLTWRIDAREEQWGRGAPLVLQPYDVIFVPNTPIDEVDIWVDQYIRRLIPFPYLVSPGV
ncbi:MAG: polysaccharide biosynthesis/export family protein [Planctomycetes bacterium]|nr:polysaccharide biosynthesis/export family protein [Planctomycetota bacterium]